MSQSNKGADVMRQIDENLRRVYEEAAGEKMPSRFEELLKKLKEQDSR